MKNIKNIIFDLGGIFLNIDFARTEKAFASLGVSQFNTLFNQHYSSNLFKLLETGKISPEEFHQSFVQQTGVRLSYAQVKEAWNALLLDFPVKRLHWLKSISKRYTIFLFSNTNEIHYDAFTESFRNLMKEDFDTYFKKAYYSHQIKLRKPDPESYLYIINEQNLNSKETLFIDDTLKNVEGASSVGLQTIHIVPPMTVLDLDL
ncbi:MAG: HAD family hydrolase [Flavisolibacter sp.]